MTVKKLPLLEWVLLAYIAQFPSRKFISAEGKIFDDLAGILGRSRDSIYKASRQLKKKNLVEGDWIKGRGAFSLQLCEEGKVLLDRIGLPEGELPGPFDQPELSDDLTRGSTNQKHSRSGAAKRDKDRSSAARISSLVNDVEQLNTQLREARAEIAKLKNSDSGKLLKQIEELTEKLQEATKRFREVDAAFIAAKAEAATEKERADVEMHRAESLRQELQRLRGSAVAA